MQVIEYPGGEVKAARVYAGPKIVGEEADILPVKLSFADRNGDRLPDMVIEIGEIERWYPNGEGGFIVQ